MYAGTKVNWHEVLMPDSVAAANDESLPLFLCAFSSDKGPEQITDLVYDDFQKLYGANPNFFKYGQPLIQAHSILAAGGRVLGKRIVAEDATLANLVILATVSSVTEQKKDEDGNLLYLDENGNETTEVTDTPAEITYAKITYSTATVQNATTYEGVLSAAEDLIDFSTLTFPLFVICDNGRGVSVKKVRISPDYDISRSMKYMLYRIADIENTNTVESTRFAVYPDAINTFNGVRKSMLLTPNSMVQFNSEMLTYATDKFVETIANITGYTKDDLYALDVLFGKTVKNKDVELIKIDEEGIDISSPYGLDLKSGTNGNFGDAPYSEDVAGQSEGNNPAEYTFRDLWAAEAVKFFNGEFSDEIFDLDQHKIDFCVDANYPVSVKKAIADLATFREDFYYFRDLGTKVATISDVQELVSDTVTFIQSPFVDDNISVYDVIDNGTRKQIKVTMNYGLAPLLVAHYSGNIAAPVAGEFNNFIISNYVPGTLNIIPRVTPNVDQKEILDDLRVNYVNLTSDNLLAVQSTYTTQDHEGPLSYVNNVIVTQMVIKAIRRYCPKIRFMLMDPGTTDFDKYRQLIEENVIERYRGYFKSISLIYTRDDEQIAAKIFNASLYCYYRDFPMGEIFDVFAVEGSPDNNPVV